MTKNKVRSYVILLVGLIASVLIAFIITCEPAAIFLAFAVYIEITRFILEPQCIPLSNESDEWEEIEPYEKN